MDALLQRKREEFTQALSHAEGVRKKYSGTSEGMTSQELEECDRAFDVADNLKKEIESLQSVMDREKTLKAWADTPAVKMVHPNTQHDTKNAKEAEYSKLFKQRLSGQISQGEFETKAYQFDVPTGGGYMATPMELVGEVLTLMKDNLYIRQMAETYQVRGTQSLGIVAIDTDPADADVTAELGTATQESTLAFGRRELRPNYIRKYIKMSRVLVLNVPDAPSKVIDRLVYKMNVTEEKKFLTGTGADEPLGIFTASSTGIPTSQDVTAANASSIVADDLINVKYNLKSQYQQQAVWVMNRTVVKAIRKLKDSNNNYLWTVGGAGQGVTGPGGGLQGTPEQLLDRPVFMSEYAPGTITTGLYTAFFGCLKFYGIADSLDLEILVNEYEAMSTNQIVYYFNKAVDGMPLLAEAFTRLKQA